MAKYKVDWIELSDGDESSSAIDSVRRYLNATTSYPELEVILALLEIKKEEEKEEDHADDQSNDR